MEERETLEDKTKETKWIHDNIFEKKGFIPVYGFVYSIVRNIRQEWNETVPDTASLELCKHTSRAITRIGELTALFTYNTAVLSALCIVEHYLTQ